MYKVLIVDSQKDNIERQSQFLNNFGFDYITSHGGKNIFRLITTQHPDIVIINAQQAEKDYLSILKSTHDIVPDIPIIVISDSSSVSTAVNAMKLGAFDYIEQPFSTEKLKTVLNDAKNKIMHIKVISDDPNELIGLNRIIGESKIITDIKNCILKVAKSNVNLFIYGESGTGKELVASCIHFLSYRSNKPFIPLDCAALPSTLIESEIFGFNKGAFTGATTSKPGMIELANEGTLFLDEIIELDPKLQVKLLRVIQERQFRRLGSTKTERVNIRIISAANCDPELAVKENKLRKDLYYRLSVVPIFLPPLRKRIEDIPLLVKHFINKFNPSVTATIKGITKDALECLKNHVWLGNIRELQNIIERAMSLTEKDIIDVEDLPDKIRQNNEFPDSYNFIDKHFIETEKMYINKFRKHYFSKMLKEYNGNISKLAREIGISRWKIYRILEGLKVED